ncbi:MAG UNVERIFIED_CONTAM: NAD-dependent epimerase/dehydratase family protein [Anaerolineae bacterium]
MRLVDLVLYEGHEAEHIVNLLQNHTAHYLFISTGQVYLVRGSSLARPFKEGDYNGEVMPAPPLHSADYSEWVYGYEKRQAEDVLAQAWQTQQFPYTSLRLPMVNGERDHFHRLYSYILRLQDGEPISDSRPTQLSPQSYLRGGCRARVSPVDREWRRQGASLQHCSR